jgi:hypothetical protein
MRFTGFSLTMAKGLHHDDKKMIWPRIEAGESLVATSCDCRQIHFPLDSHQRIRVIFSMNRRQQSAQYQAKALTVILKPGT